MRSRRRRTPRALGVVVLAAIAMPGCTRAEPIYREWREWISNWVAKTAAEHAPPTRPNTEADTAQDPRETLKNAELLQEIFRVVLARDQPLETSEFANWLDSVNQGAALDAVYNGLTHSSDYRALESTSPGASPQTLRVFSEELARLELELPRPTVFDFSADHGLPEALPPGVDAEKAPDGVEVIDFKKPREDQGSKKEPAPKPSPAALATQYQREFAAATLHTLKRVLGDEALKVVAHHSSYRERLALWYSRWAAALAKRKVSFGVAQRQSTDEGFHYRWALKAPDDHLKWEVLNRLHRLLNHAQQPGQQATPRK